MPACCTRDNFTGNLSRLEPFNDKRLMTGGRKESYRPISPKRDCARCVIELQWNTSILPCLWSNILAHSFISFIYYFITSATTGGETACLTFWRQVFMNILSVSHWLTNTLSRPHSYAIGWTNDADSGLQNRLWSTYQLLVTFRCIVKVHCWYSIELVFCDHIQMLCKQNDIFIFSWNLFFSL